MDNRFFFYMFGVPYFYFTDKLSMPSTTLSNLDRNEDISLKKAPEPSRIISIIN